MSCDQWSRRATSGARELAAARERLDGANAAARSAQPPVSKAEIGLATEMVRQSRAGTLGGQVEALQMRLARAEGQERSGAGPHAASGR